MAHLRVQAGLGLRFRSRDESKPVSEQSWRRAGVESKWIEGQSGVIASIRARPELASIVAEPRRSFS